jgi:hypothetical protein
MKHLWICALLLVLVVGCTPVATKHLTETTAVNQFGEKDPCHDSLFVALQQRPYNSLTAYEHAYFDQMWQECNGTDFHNRGNAPEWIMASFAIHAFVISIAALIR